MLVKEYMNDCTNIKIYDDYCSKQDEENNIKNIIINLLLRNMDLKCEKC